MPIFPNFSRFTLAVSGDSKLRDRVTGVAIATAVYFAASALIQAPTGGNPIAGDVFGDPKWPNVNKKLPKVPDGLWQC